MLIVDDDSDARELLSTLLTQAGALVSSASDATEAFDEVVRFRPEVLVSDIGMAGEDGYSLMRRVRALSADAGGRVPAIALTAYTRREDRAKAIDAGFNLHLGKPVKPADLLAALAELGAR